MLIPEAAICRANSLPIPDEAPVTRAQGPNLFLSSATLTFLLRSTCLGLVVSSDHLVTPIVSQLPNYLQCAFYSARFRLRRVVLRVHAAWLLTSFESNS